MFFAGWAALLISAATAVLAGGAALLLKAVKKRERPRPPAPRALTLAVLGVLTAALSGCSGIEEPPAPAFSSESAEASSALYPESFMVPMGENNYFDYQPGMECAAFASAFVLRHHGLEADGLTLFENFPSRAPDGGTMPSGIVTLFSEKGFQAEYVEDGTVDALKQELSKGNPVIVFIHVEEPYTSTHNTHYVPLVGYDSDYFYFAESLAAYANCQDTASETGYNRKTEIEKFKRLWANIDGVWDYPYYVIREGAASSA